MKSFLDKLVVITGGSSGIGLALARNLVSQGARVYILSRDKKRLQHALELMKQNLLNEGQEVGIIQGDITNQKEINHLLNTWMEKHGTPDLLINSAGVAHPGYFTELDTEIFEWTMRVNYFGTVYVSKAIVPNMIVRGSGHVVNISSEAGFVGVFGYTAYGASKYAVRGFSDALRAELKPMGIGMTIVFPPDTDTPQLKYEEQFKPYETKMIGGSSKLMAPEKVAAIILSHVKKGHYLVIPGFEGKIFYRITSILKHGTYPIMDILVRSAQRKKYKKLSSKLD